MKLLLLTFMLLSSLLANKVIYLSYDKVPQRVVKGEIFPITLKTLSTTQNFYDINYSFSDYDGLKILTSVPQREKKGKYFYDTFYLLSTQKLAKLPDVEASLIAEGDYNSTKIFGDTLNIIELNPKNDFSNIIANDLKILEYKTTSYDDQHNIVVFVASANNSNIAAMHFKNVFKQGIESVKDSYDESKITYFLVIDKNIEVFSLSYFNLLQNSFIQLHIPIIVDDDSVTTQSDLKPTDHSHEKLKIEIAAVITILALILTLIRRRYIYVIFIIIPLIYIVLLAMPEKKICIKKGSNIYLLPVSNGTIFETTHSQYYLPKEGSVKKFIKVTLENQKIGWVKNEDTCSY